MAPQIGAPVYGTVTVKVRQPVSKRILIVDADPDITLTFKGDIENNNGNDGTIKELKYIQITIQHALILMNTPLH